MSNDNVRDELGPTLGGAPHTQEQVRRLMILQMQEWADTQNAANALDFANEADDYWLNLAQVAGKPEAAPPGIKPVPALVLKVVSTPSEGGPLGRFVEGPERVAPGIADTVEAAPPEGVAIIGQFLGVMRRTGSIRYQCPANDTALVGREVTVSPSGSAAGPSWAFVPQGKYRKIPSGSIAGNHWEKIA